MSQQAAVPLSATVQSSPARITLAWTTLPSTTSITIYRKSISATSWGSVIATPAATDLSYADNAVAIATAYEYKVVRVAGGVTGTGYLSTGIAVPPVDYRGRMILLVDNAFTGPLATELAELKNDLRMDGWSVVRVDLSRSASVATVKSAVVAQYNADPTNTKALYIVGHLAVPYSGNINPDGHGEHLGAWPCDGYYGELNGTWTDASVNNNASQRPQNRNVPGDGKFDQNNFPSDVELQVGRVDFFDLPAFSTSETELMRNYLVKAHGFKMKFWTPTPRGLVFDNLQWINNPIAATAWRTMAAMVGAANVTAANQYAQPFYQLVNNQSYLWTYSSGGGTIEVIGSTVTYNGLDLVGTTQDFATTSSHWGVFNMCFGSNVGDWDNTNNFMRAPLASGYALTNCWAGIPAWYVHHMGMGANIGQSTLVSMNNSGLYTPLTDGWQSSIGRSHLGLMGDPSLRQKMLLGPSNLSATNAAGNVSFSWSPSTETVDGYHIYAIDGTTGVITRITSSVITGTTFASAIPFAAGKEYMVRAVRLITEPSGSYHNLSLGASVITSGSAALDCAGVAGGPAQPGTPCNDGVACTTNDTWSTSCQCAGVSSTPVATITAGGSTTFCNGGSVTLTASSGTGYTYQWRNNGSNIGGATGSGYTSTASGSYSVVVSNGGCSTTSSSTTVTVNTAPTATISASGPTTFCSGGSVTLTANSGTGYTYQWRNNGANISGATSSSYAATASGSYSVIVTNGGCSTTSSTTTVTVSSSPSANVTASGSTSFCTGGNVVLSASTGSGYTYQWKKNGTNISGATSSAYTATTSGAYSLVITAGACSSTSASTTVTVNTAPTATISASGVTTFCSGGSVTLTANSGTGYTYQWRNNGANISGATSSSYTATASGSYSVIVTNGGCSTTSSPTTVTVSSSPSATVTAGGSTSFCTGGNVVLNASTGSGYTYQWKKNGTNISGATSSAYTATTSGTYSVVITAGACSSTSASTTVTVNTAPTATISASGATTFCSGGSVTLTANSGTGYTYQWRNNGTNINGATSSSYTTSTSGSYSAVVSIGGCSATSSALNTTALNGPSLNCSASPANGTVSVSVTGGTAPFSYSWNTSPAQFTATASVTGSGTYTVMVSDANGCTSTCTSTLTMVTSSGPCTGFVTAAQGTWGAPATAYNVSGYMTNGFTTAFPPPNGLTIGCGSRFMRFTTSAAIITALPSYGTPNILPNGTTVNPSAPGNSLVGQLVAAKLNARYDEIDPDFAPYQGLIRDLVITTGTFAGWTFQQLINEADLKVGGCASNYSYAALSSALTTINNGYDAPGEDVGYLTCAASISGPAEVSCTGFVLAAQGTWGATATAYNVAGYMVAGFGSALPGADGLTIGCGSRSMRFTSSSAIIAALPSYGTPAILPSGITVNPISPGNTLVGQLVAAKLNVRYDEMDPDFAPYEGLIKDLVITSGTFVGMTVQQLIDLADQIIGGCSSTYSYATVSSALTTLNNGYDEPGEDVGFLACATTAGMILQDQPVEIASILEPMEVVVYPVPTRGQTTVLLSGIEVDGDIVVELLSVLGVTERVLFNGSAEAGVQKSIAFDASGLAPGPYLCRVIMGDRVTSRRIIVQ
ncbi:MAG: hypothetical protein IPI81_12680 [Flavobacteriales bacterium]|nr:hypothetical protein [Flavobacteriales bacterium]